MTMQPTTPDEQEAAMDTLVRMALTNDQGPMSFGLADMLSTLPRESGKQVAAVLVMLAGKAVPDDDDWRDLLIEHLTGASG